MPIPRRSFLKTVAASVFPAAALHDLVAQASAVPIATPELHIVGSGQDRFGDTHTLGYSAMTFKVGTAETAGNMFVIEHANMKIGGGPGFHLHFNQEEYFYVLEGEVAFQVGDKRVQLKAGESILGPRRVPHCFAAVSPSRMLIAFTPAGKMEPFFRETQKNPALLMDAAFNSQYEMQLVGPSPLWRS
jgi:mannose-6-phosphate isomerase-like protein (cupin superfamily)